MSDEPEDKINDNPLRSANYVRYDPQTGAIVAHGYTQIGAIERQIARGDPVILSSGEMEGHWVNPVTRTVHLKEELPADHYHTTLINLPIPCRIEIEDQSYICTSGWADIEFDAPGTYEIIVHSVPHAMKTYTVTIDD